MRNFAIGFENQWRSGTIDIIRIGSHVCPACDMFYIGLLGFIVKIGFITIDQ